MYIDCIHYFFLLTYFVLFELIFNYILFSHMHDIIMYIYIYIYIYIYSILYTIYYILCIINIHI